MPFFGTLCGSCRRKPATSGSPSLRSRHSKASNRSKTETSNHILEPEEQDERITELDAAIHGPIYPTIPDGSTSKRRLSVSLSASVKEGLSKIRTKKEKAGAEDSLWKKTIILGEKCRVPGEDGEEANTAALSGSMSQNALGEKCRFPGEDGEEANIVPRSGSMSQNATATMSRDTSFASAATHS